MKRGIPHETRIMVDPRSVKFPVSTKTEMMLNQRKSKNDHIASDDPFPVRLMRLNRINLKALAVVKNQASANPIKESARVQWIAIPVVIA